MAPYFTAPLKNVSKLIFLNFDHMQLHAPSINNGMRLSDEHGIVERLIENNKK